MSRHLEKDVIYRRVQDRMRRWYGEDEGDKLTSGMGCLYWMHAGLVTLQQHGIQAVPACGTAHWQCTPDDGQMTHFGFEWGGDPQGALRREVALGGGAEPLPEMHCWIWIPSTQEVVDFSAGHVPTLAKAMGFEWKVAPPPPYIWAGVKFLYPRAVYIPHRDATKLAIQTLVAGHKGTKQ